MDLLASDLTSCLINEKIIKYCSSSQPATQPTVLSNGPDKIISFKEGGVIEDLPRNNQKMSRN